MIERAAQTKPEQDLPSHWRPFGRVLEAIQKLEIRAVAPCQQAARRLGEPGEVAEAVVWLCSDAASFVNGHAMAIDGGYLAKQIKFRAQLATPQFLANTGEGDQRPTTARGHSLSFVPAPPMRVTLKAFLSRRD
jgi:hypothetical protein